MNGVISLENITQLILQAQGTFNGTVTSCLRNTYISFCLSVRHVISLSRLVESATNGMRKQLMRSDST